MINTAKEIIKELCSQSLIDNFFLSLKLSSLFGFSLSLSPIVSQWFVTNIDYVFISVLAVAIDHALGSYVHKFIKKDWNWRKNISGFGVKLSMVVAVGILMEGLAHITIEDNFIYTYIKMIGRFIVIIYPTLSALKNVKIITKGAFPPDALIGKLETFNQDLDLKKLKEDEKNY
jgi:hypothetical protein